MDRELADWARERAFRAAVGPVSLVHTVRKRLKRLKEKGEIQLEFFLKNLNSFTHLEGCPIQSPQSLVVVAIPRPAHIIKVDIKGEKKKLIFPPTYVNYLDVFNETLLDFKHELAGKKWQASLINAPLKSLAVELGLAVYGKNNITYISEFGSYFQLVGIVTNIPLKKKSLKKDGELLGKERIAERCESCRACFKACPLQAIPQERFLLRAERCYVSYSESAENIPPGMKSPSPECIIGCLKCQEVCPLNKSKFKVKDTGIYLSHEETEIILKNVPFSSSHLSNLIKEKLKSLRLTENYEIYYRNLRHLLQEQCSQVED